jgi:hypothetical protein
MTGKRGPRRCRGSVRSVILRTGILRGKTDKNHLTRALLRANVLAFRARQAPHFPIGKRYQMANPQIGELYAQPRPGYPTPVQPGGAGNPVVDPAQPAVIYIDTPENGYTPATNPTAWAEKANMYQSGCGHTLRSWDIRSDTVNGAPALVQTCPLCGWLAAIWQPPSVFYDNFANPIVS